MADDDAYRYSVAQVQSNATLRERVSTDNLSSQLPLGHPALSVLALPNEPVFPLNIYHFSLTTKTMTTRAYLFSEMPTKYACVRDKMKRDALCII